MAEQPTQFIDGEAYERGMGAWSRLAGHVFLDWLAPQSGLQWIDIGCGSGAFTELIMQRCAPADIQAIDPSEAQLSFARKRPGANGATFHQGDAMALPFERDRFDAAAMALVLFFVPEPTKGVAEMVRVVCPGGMIAAYVWDMPGGGFPFEPVFAEMRALGTTVPFPPRADVSRITALQDLWTDAGLEMIETRDITVRRTFTDFEEFWSLSQGPMRPVIAGMDPRDVDKLRARTQARLTAEPSGRFSYQARANAIKGRRPKAL